MIRAEIANAFAQNKKKKWVGFFIRRRQFGPDFVGLVPGRITAHNYTQRHDARLIWVRGPGLPKKWIPEIASLRIKRADGRFQDL